LPKEPKPPASVYTAREFFLEDLPRTLFPLTTNRILVERGHDKLLEAAEYIVANGSFLPQRRVYANKDRLHLRRTVKLDPVAEFYFYHLIFKNRARFRKPHRDDRQHYGYRFEEGRPIPPSKSYSDFKSDIFLCNAVFNHHTYFDISSYFNGLYHHDLHAWFAALNPDDSNDTVAFGKLLREMNAGRTLDCLPQGIYPAKMIGNDFLRFLEHSASLKAMHILRFMDDVYLYHNDPKALTSDFAEVQRLLDLRGLAVNPSKTQSAQTPGIDDPEDQVSELKKRLLKRRRNIIISHYVMDDYEGDDAPEEETALSEEELQYVLSLLSAGTLNEEDAELTMIVMRDHVDRIEQHLLLFADGFPHLAKNFYGLCSEAPDKETVGQVVLNVARAGDHIGEFQLFWFGMMLESYLLNTKAAPALVQALYHHQSATDISRAKILEIADHRFGLPELREPFLRDGRSDWLSWASAVGTRSMDKQARNYTLDYFANRSDMNRIISSILKDD
jgi:hypothetical protein